MASKLTNITFSSHCKIQNSSKNHLFVIVRQRGLCKKLNSTRGVAPEPLPLGTTNSLLTYQLPSTDVSPGQLDCILIEISFSIFLCTNLWQKEGEVGGYVACLTEKIQLLSGPVEGDGCPELRGFSTNPKIQHYLSSEIHSCTNQSQCLWDAGTLPDRTTEQEVWSDDPPSRHWVLKPIFRPTRLSPALYWFFFFFKCHWWNSGCLPYLVPPLWRLSFLGTKIFLESVIVYL